MRWFMKFQLCKWVPISPLHLGERETWQEGSSVFIHSDTLFSGICHCYSLLYGKSELDNFIAKIVQQNILKLSSAFPFWENILYFPIPKNQIPNDKKAYKIKFIEQAGFEQLIVGQKLEDLISEGRKVIPRNEKISTPWELENVPRITLNRLNNHPQEEGGFFHSGRVTYRSSAGLFFLFQLDDSTEAKRFEATIRLLAENGIGGDRSVGNGLMEFDNFETLELQVPENQDAQVSLSLYYPHANEVVRIEEAYYELIERKGYIYSPTAQSLRRKSVRMFLEGSVFPFIQNRRGKIEDVKPAIFKDHNVVRNGHFFGLPCRKEVN